MLEWMHDKSVVENLRADFVSKTLKNCVEFIESSQVDKNNLHLAIVDASDDYMGTISLKHIKDGTAEFGIVLRSVAIGKGYSKEAMQAILNKGFNEMRLSSIYWCVNPKNKRAIRFYEKNGYQQISPNALESSHIHIEQGGGTTKKKFRISTGTAKQDKRNKQIKQIKQNKPYYILNHTGNHTETKESYYKSCKNCDERGIERAC